MKPFLGPACLYVHHKELTQISEEEKLHNEKYVAVMWCKKKSEEKIVSCIIKFEEKHFFVQQKGMEREATCDSVAGEQGKV